MLKAIHAQEDRKGSFAEDNSCDKKAARHETRQSGRVVKEGIEETVSYYEVPSGALEENQNE